MSPNRARSFPAAHGYYFATAPFDLALSWLVQLHKTTVVLVVVSSHAKDSLKDKLEEKSNKMCLTGVEPQSLSRSHPKKLEDEVSLVQTWGSWRGAASHPARHGLVWSITSSPTRVTHVSEGCHPLLMPAAMLECSSLVLLQGKCPRQTPQGFRSPSCCHVRGLQPGQGTCPQDLWMG